MHICLFDIDGTLIDSGGAGQSAMENTLREQFGQSGPISGISTAGRTDRAIVRDLFVFYGIADTPDHWQRMATAYPLHLRHQLPRKPGRILPGIRALLQQLAQRDNVVLGLLTGNFRCGAQLKLRHYELETFFEWDWGVRLRANATQNETRVRDFCLLRPRMNGAAAMAKAILQIL